MQIDIGTVNINTIITLGGVFISSFLLWKGNKVEFQLVHSAIKKENEERITANNHTREYIDGLKERYTQEITNVKSDIRSVDNVIYDKIQPKIGELEGGIKKNCEVLQLMNKECLRHKTHI